MNKLDLASKLADDTGLTKVTALAAVESVLDGISQALTKGEAVTLIGFGSFRPVVRKARTGRNPATGAPLKIPRATVARFTPGATLKKALSRS